MLKIFNKIKQQEKLKELKKENYELHDRIDNVVSHLESDIISLNYRKRCLLETGRIGPENGYIIVDIDIEIRKYKNIIDILMNGVK